MKEIILRKTMLRKTPEPVLHGVFLSNGKFITPAEMEIMKSLGVIRATKT
ncbi:hypothetical protein [Methanosarcina sp. UBA289]|nr:hypothetical protein [Methanosarcina sp. UBA289]